MLRLDIHGVTAEEARGFIIEGLERQRTELAAKISAVSFGPDAPAAKTTKRSSKLAQGTATGKGKGSMSAEGKAKIAAAQKKRWAKVRKETKAAAAAQAEAAVETQEEVSQAESA